MKKPIAIVLLIAGGLAAAYVSAAVCMLLFPVLMEYGLPAVGSLN